MLISTINLVKRRHKSKNVTVKGGYEAECGYIQPYYFIFDIDPGTRKNNTLNIDDHCPDIHLDHLPSCGP
jgi:hypothetical protein